MMVFYSSLLSIPERAGHWRRWENRLSWICDFYSWICKRKGNGRTQLKKMRIFLNSLMRLVLYVIEGEEFAYRCLNDVSARQSRKIEPLFHKNIRSCGMAYSPEEIFFWNSVLLSLLDFLNSELLIFIVEKIIKRVPNAVNGTSKYFIKYFFWYLLFD